MNQRDDLTTEERIGRLEASVGHLEDGIKNLNYKIDQMLSRSQFSWGIFAAMISSVCAVLLIAGALSWQAMIPFARADEEYEKRLNKIDNKLIVDDKREQDDAYSMGRRDATLDAVKEMVELHMRDNHPHTVLQKVERLDERTNPGGE